jgi:methionine-rich copper-binding protein CopC
MSQINPQHQEPTHMKISPHLALAAMIVALAGAANAHPRLNAASPAPNAVLTSSPAEIRIAFSEGLIARFSGLEVADQAGRKAGLGSASVSPSNNKQLVAAVRAPLAPGAYVVSWHVVGDDTHHVSGRYSFQVKR